MKGFGKQLVILCSICIIISTIILSLSGINIFKVINIDKILNVKTVYILFMIVLPIIYIIKLKTKKEKKEVSNGITNEEQLVKFNEVYNNIVAKYKIRVENERRDIKGRILRTTIIIISFIISIILGNVNEKLGAIFAIVSWLGCLRMITTNDKYKNKYIKNYKKNILETIVKSVDERLNYYPDEVRKSDIYFRLNLDMQDIDIYKIPGMDSEIKAIIEKQKNISQSDEYIDLVSKNDKLRVVRYDDYINGVLDENIKIDMANVVADNKSVTSFFEGILSVTRTNKSIGSTIYIDKNKKTNIYKANKIQLDSEEFEKMFDVCAEDKILATRLLTSEIMQMIIDFKLKNNLDFQIYIKEDIIYLSFNTGPIFEPKIFTDTVNKESLYRYYCVLKFVIDITKEINKTIKEIDI